MTTYKLQNGVRVWDTGDELLTTGAALITLADIALRCLQRIAIVGALIKFIFGGVL